MNGNYNDQGVGQHTYSIYLLHKHQYKHQEVSSPEYHHDKANGIQALQAHYLPLSEFKDTLYPNPYCMD